MMTLLNKKTHHRRTRPRPLAHIKRNVVLLSVINMLRCSMFVLPVIMPYMHLKAGISFGDFVMAEAIFALTLVLMEVPSGYLSDLWTRKKTVIAGVFIEALGFLLLITAHDMPSLIMGQIVTGIGISLISGTDTAMLYDTLLEGRLVKHFTRTEGLRHGVGLYAVGGSSLLGAWLYNYSPDAVAWMTVASVTLAGLCGFLLYEPQRAKEAMRQNPFRDVVQSVDLATRKMPYIGVMILLTAIVFGVNNAAFWMQQPYYNAIALPIILYGVFSATGQIMGGLGSQVAHRLSGHIRTRSVMLIALLWLSSAFIMAGLYQNLVGAFLLISVSAIYGLSMPIIKDAINRRIGSERRATILSCLSLSMRLVFVMLGMATGAVINAYSVYAALILLAALMLIFGLPVLFWLYRISR